MSAMLAKRMGAKKVMVLIQRRAYVDLVQGSVIDIAISPNRRPSPPCWGTCAKRISSAFHRCAVAWQKRSKRLPTVMKARPKWSAASSKTSSCHRTTIGAIVRGDDVIIANGNSKIEQGDHVIMFITDKKFVPDVERLFQPSPFFL